MLQPKKTKGNKTVKNSDFIKQWMDSPMYNKMLKESDPKNFQNNKQDRIDNYNNISVNYNANRPTGTSSNIGGETNGTNINVYDKNKIIQNRIVTHEKSHATDAPIKNMDYYINNFKNNIGLSNTPKKRIIPESDINLINKYKPNNVSDIPAFNGMKKALGNSFNPKEYDFLYDKKTVDYLSQPTETRARLNALREEAFNNNIYNPLKEPINKQQYDALKNNINIKSNNYNQLKDLKSIYNDDEIINLLNTVSQNNENKLDNIKLAAYGGKINTNMNRYAQGGDLTQFNEGGLHSQNPLGGVPIGNNNSVEQGETKQDNFIYSNRIFLDENTVSQYNLPKSLIGKSVADATKLIDSKFKGRNDKISQSTKNGMLSKIAEAQESMKPQEPEVEQPQEGMEQPQMAYGGNINRYESGQQLGDTFVNMTTTGADMLLPGSGQLLKMGDQLGQSVGESIGGDRGESIGGLLNPMGTIRGLGSALKTGNINDIPGIGIFGGQTTLQKEKLKQMNAASLNANAKFSDQYSLGGDLTTSKKITISNLINTPIVEGVKPVSQEGRFRYAVGEQGGVQHGTSGEQGHYLYYGKKPGDPGFNPNIHREFVNQGGYDTYMKSPQGQQYKRNLSAQSLQPIEQLGYGGKMKQMGDGGDYYENLILSNNNTDPNYSETDLANAKRLPLKSILETSGLKSVGATTPYTIGTQPIVDISNANRQFTSGPSFGRQVWEGTKAVGKYGYENAGNLARYAPIAANALQLAQLKKPQGERLDRLSNRYKPEYVDEAALQNIANQTMNNSVNAIGQSGASQGQLRSSIIGSQLERTKALSDAYSQAAAQNRATNDRAQTFNLGVDQTNLQQSTNEKDINARDQAAYRNEKSKYISAIGSDIGDVGKEQVQKKMISTATGYTYDGKYVRSPDGNIVTDPDTGEPMTGGKLKESKSSKNVKKQALGGYLIKNKLK